MARLPRAPLLHFLALGTLLLAARSGLHVRPAPSPAALAAADVERLRATRVAEWSTEHGAPPGAAVEAALGRDAVDDEILYREALAAGLDRADDVRERLVRLAGFLGEEETSDPARLERQARRLGLERNDLVIRRHLVDLMRLALRHPSPTDAPTDTELDAYVADHVRTLAAPATVRLAHVYLSADLRGADTARDAAAALDEVRRTGGGPDTVPGRGDPFGDPFILGSEIGPASRADLERVFGAGFASAVDAAPVGAWTGPVPSTYGLHLVWVRERVPAQAPPLASVRRRLLLDLLAERGAARAAERMRALRARWGVE